jgi:hypothetical protein
MSEFVIPVPIYNPKHSAGQPKASNLPPDFFVDFVPVADRLPSKVGQYQCIVMSETNAKQYKAIRFFSGKRFLKNQDAVVTRWFDPKPVDPREGIG